MKNKEKRSRGNNNKPKTNNLEKEIAAKQLILQKKKRNMFALTIAMIVIVGVVLAIAIPNNQTPEKNTIETNSAAQGSYEIVNSEDANIAIPTTNTTNPSNTGDGTPNTLAGEAVVLNPPHGQPGHRCEIPVGSPLNSTGNASTNTTASSNVNNQKVNTTSGSPVLNTKPTQATITPPVKTAPIGSTVKLNPPHGQPGHRCDIPVGSAL